MMAESAVSFLLDQLSIWLQEERSLLGGLTFEAQVIHGELEQMRAFLSVADAKEETDPQLKVWVRQVREISYDVEDVLETYLLRFAPHRHAGIGGRLKRLYASVKNLRARHGVASEIKALRLRAENASKTYRDVYAAVLGSSLAGVTSDVGFDGRGDALLLEEADVVGIESPKMKLMGWISSADYIVKVVSVVGMAGLGKTTLVRKVYNDPSVKENFDHHAWITVSEAYKVESLLLDTIKQLLQEVEQPLPPGLETMNVDGMREFIYSFFQNKKYVIVLDDIWSVNVWEALKLVFLRTTTHGRGCIIITTRFNNIGDAACSESGACVHALEPLSPQYAEELFHRKAFPGGSCPQHLKELSESIFKRCGGLPLAIVLIGSALATKKNEFEEWRKLSLGMGFEVEGDNLKRMWKLLSLSFYDLPYYLKTCFLFLSIFPEDHLLEKATIIRLWMAEGFLEAKQGKTMDEIAYGYLRELCNRSLIQVAETFADGRPRKFRIHDLVRGYSIAKAKEQNMVAGQSQDERHGQTEFDI